MTIPAYYILIFFMVATLFPLLGVALGGYLVFRTKKESHESLFPGKEKPGDAFLMKQEWEQKTADETDEMIKSAGGIIKDVNAEFNRQYATHEPKIVETLGKEEEK